MPKKKKRKKKKKESTSQTSSSPSSSNNSSSWQKMGMIVIIILLAISIGGFAWAYTNYKKSQETIQNLKTNQQQQLSDQRRKEIVNKVGEHMVLPEGQPAVVTITNPGQLAQQEDFFKQAEQDDALLLYRTKAILYRSSTDKIVDVQPVTTRNSTSTAQTSTQTGQAESITVDVRNGGAPSGSASDLANRLDQFSNIQVEDVANAATTSYNETVLINNSQKDISALESQLGVEATDELPEGEAPSPYDVIIILAE